MIYLSALQKDKSWHSFLVLLYNKNVPFSHCTIFDDFSPLLERAERQCTIFVPTEKTKKEGTTFVIPSWKALIYKVFLSQSISLTDLRVLFRDVLRLLPSRVLYRGLHPGCSSLHILQVRIFLLLHRIRNLLSKRGCLLL